MSKLVKGQGEQYCTQPFSYRLAIPGAYEPPKHTVVSESDTLHRAEEGSGHVRTFELP